MMQFFAPTSGASLQTVSGEPLTKTQQQLIKTGCAKNNVKLGQFLVIALQLPQRASSYSCLSENAGLPEIFQNACKREYFTRLQTFLENNGFVLQIKFAMDSNLEMLVAIADTNNFSDGFSPEYFPALLANLDFINKIQVAELTIN